MVVFLTIIHVVVSFFLILVVLLQQGKGQDIGSAFGGGGTQATFGARSGATMLTKLTTVSAVVFMLTSLTLTIMISRPGAESVIDEDAIAVPPAGIEDTLPINEVPTLPADAADDAGAVPAEDTGGLAPAPEDDAGN